MSDKEKPDLKLVRQETRGRKPHRPTEKTKRYVRAATRAKCKKKDIAKALGISIPTLEKHYSSQMAKGTTDLPRVAQHKLYLFLNKDFSDNPELQEKQAKLGLSYLRSDTLKSSENGDLLNALPSILVGVKKTSEG